MNPTYERMKLVRIGNGETIEAMVTNRAGRASVTRLNHLRKDGMPNLVTGYDGSFYYPGKMDGAKPEKPDHKDWVEWREDREQQAQALRDRITELRRLIIETSGQLLQFYEHHHA